MSIVDEPIVLNYTFLFDWIPTDVEELITKNIKWTKGTQTYKGEKLPYHQEVHRLCMITPLYKPIITFKDCRMINLELCQKNCGLTEVDKLGGFFQFDRWKGSAGMFVDRVDTKIRTNKKGLISYTKKYVNFKEIVC